MKPFLLSRHDPVEFITETKCRLKKALITLTNFIDGNG